MIRLIQFTVLLNLKKQVNSMISLAFSENKLTVDYRKLNHVAKIDNNWTVPVTFSFLGVQRAERIVSFLVCESEQD